MSDLKFSLSPLFSSQPHGTPKQQAASIRCQRRSPEYLLPDDGNYTGRYFEGLRAGSGTLAFPSGHLYRGKFYKGEMHGWGHLSFPSGAEYYGLFDR